MMPSSAVASEPIVSVVIATYNRAEALRHAIASVLRSTLHEWELIVVGDACTDESAACVESFGDPRIRWVNLPVRCGDQSGPNTHGAAMARGRYIAFLNHDDLYFPEHLSRCVAELEASNADLVWAASVRLLPEQEHTPAGRFRFFGIPPGLTYAPTVGYFASTWVLKRELAGRVGAWLPPGRSYVSPSQAWLFRAWRAGAVLRFVPSLGVALIPAGERPGSYAQRDCPEQAWLSDWMASDPRCRERVLEEAAMNEAVAHVASVERPRLWALRRMVLRPIYALLTACGVHPASLSHLLRYGRRGGFVRVLRSRTGAN